MLASNQAALLAIAHPRRQSGQDTIGQIYDTVRMLAVRQNRVEMVLVPAGCGLDLARKAKAEAKKATKDGNAFDTRPKAKSTAVNAEITKQNKYRSLPNGVGEYSRKLDPALPGRHTQGLYDMLDRRGARVPAQLRTGRARLNGHLHQIGAAESDLCDCGAARETVKHFVR
ncbi:hypothetical protein PSPO01_15889 [Paraphaeosphaeria sporulosa]